MFSECFELNCLSKWSRLHPTLRIKLVIILFDILPRILRGIFIWEGGRQSRQEDVAGPGFCLQEKGRCFVPFKIPTSHLPYFSGLIGFIHFKISPCVSHRPTSSHQVPAHFPNDVWSHDRHKGHTLGDPREKALGCKGAVACDDLERKTDQWPFSNLT